MVDESVRVNEKFTPAKEFIVSDLETLKVLADPLRLSILQYLNKPGTVKQIAEKIDKPPTKLYYHFNLLEKHRLIKMVDTRIVSGIIEKHYQVSAQTYLIAEGLLSPNAENFDEGLDLTISGIFADARLDIRESIRSGAVDISSDAPESKRLMINQGMLHLSEAQTQDFQARLMTLIEEFQDLDHDDQVTQNYKMLVMLHPTNRGSKDNTD